MCVYVYVCVFLELQSKYSTSQDMICTYILHMICTYMYILHMIHNVHTTSTYMCIVSNSISKSTHCSQQYPHDDPDSFILTPTLKENILVINGKGSVTL